MNQVSHSNKNWFEKWFNEDYFELYQHRDTKDAKEQIGLIEKTLSLADKKIIDVGCGSGRHTYALHSKGYDVVGIDLSKSMIDIGKNLYPEIKLKVMSASQLVHYPNQYQIALSLFTGFGYFKTEKDNANYLTAIATSLSKGGFLWLDYLNATHIESTADKPENDSQKKWILFVPPKKPPLPSNNPSQANGLTNKKANAPEHEDPQKRGDIQKEKRDIQKVFRFCNYIEGKRIKKDIYVYEIDMLEYRKKNPSWSDNPMSKNISQEFIEKQNPTRKYFEDVGLYKQEAILEMAKIAGLSLVNSFGDYIGRPMTKNSARNIYLFQKNGTANPQR